MKRINDLLPHAMKALKDSGLVLQGNRILEEYDGYVASFPPSVITAGLRATLSFYSDKHKESNDPGAQPRRNHILKILHQIYRSGSGALQGEDLLTIALSENRTGTELGQLKKDLTDAAIALKLVMRNFNQVDKTALTTTDHETSTPV